MMACLSLPSNTESNTCPDLKYLLGGDLTDINHILKCCKSTRLHHLLSKGLREETLQLINKGANVNLKDKNGQTALHVAVTKKSVSLLIVKIITEKTLDINVTDIGGKAALHLAISSANSAAVKVLLQAGSNINIQDYAGNSPLHYAFNHCLDLVETLVEHGANVELKNKLDETPLHIAVGAKVVVSITKFIEAVKLILKKGANINVTSVNIPNNQGNYPLHLATERRNLESVKLLLDNGAVIDSKNKDNATALHLVTANEETSEPIVSLLINRGASINVQDVNGMTPLHNSVKNLNTETVQLLLENGAEVNSKNKKGETPLLIVPSKKSGWNTICKTLLSNGATPNVQDNSGMTPLHNAVKYNNVEIVQLLLENGAGLNSKNKMGETPLRYVQCVTILKLLLQKGARVNEQDNFGRTALHNISKDLKNLLTNYSERVPHEFRLLLSGGIYASSVVLKLLEWGASNDIKDNLGKIPSDYFLFSKIQKKYDIKMACLYSTYNTKRNVQDSPKYQRLENDCFEEIGKMKMKLFRNNCLYDIFRYYGDPTFLSNRVLESVVKSKLLSEHLPVYCCLLRSTYHRSKERLQLFDPAVDILQTNCHLPREVLRYILSFVDNDSLRNLIKAKEEFPIEKELDCTSKSETESNTESVWKPEWMWSYDSEDDRFDKTF